MPPNSGDGLLQTRLRIWTRKNVRWDYGDIKFLTWVHSWEQVDHALHGDQNPSMTEQGILHSTTWTPSPTQNWPLFTGEGLLSNKGQLINHRFWICVFLPSYLQWRTRFWAPWPHLDPVGIRHGDQLPQLLHSPFTKIKKVKFSSS